MKIHYLAAALIIVLPLGAQAKRAAFEDKAQETVAATPVEPVRLLDTQKDEVVSETGKITASTSYFDLQKKKMGTLWDGALNYQEGTCRVATVAYRGTPSEIEVFWKDAPDVKCFSKLDLDWNKLKKPELVRVHRADSTWATDQGIKVGTTLEELEKLNGGSIGFIGMSWDLGGACCMGKAFSKHIGLTLEADQSVIHEKSDVSAYYTEHLTGDQKIESKDIPEDIKKKLNIRVKEIFLNF